MLSKSAAKTFFLVGTALCSVAFVLLTVDTISQVPERTHEENLTPAVARGKDLWDSNNCMGCHTLMGEGAYYAPELTLVYERRGPDFIRAMLRDPESMYPGQRRMQQYDFTDEEIEDLVAFFEWIGHVDLNGFPPQPVLASTGAPSSASTAPVGRDDGRPEIFGTMCVACHAVDGRGGNVGPALDGIADRRDPEYLDRWLHDPAAVKQGARMPRLPLSEEQIASLTAYLSTLSSAAPGTTDAPVVEAVADEGASDAGVVDATPVTEPTEPAIAEEQP